MCFVQGLYPTFLIFVLEHGCSFLYYFFVFIGLEKHVLDGTDRKSVV